MDFINHIFKEINDNYYVYLRETTKNTIRFKVLSDEEITRNVYLEKLYDYLTTVNIKNNIDADKKESANLQSCGCRLAIFVNEQNNKI